MNKKNTKDVFNNDDMCCVFSLKKRKHTQENTMQKYKRKHKSKHKNFWLEYNVCSYSNIVIVSKQVSVFYRN